MLGAVANVNGEIATALDGRSFECLADLDRALCDLDGTDTKGRLGANAIVGVSMAAARAMATADQVPLHEWLAPAGVQPRLPVPCFNVINGGRHAANALQPQEFMICPIGVPSFAEALRAGAEIYAALRSRLGASGLAIGLGDEGGFAPELHTTEHALDLIVDAIGDAGYRAGTDGVAIALDPAASEFCNENGTYQLSLDDPALTGSELIDRWEDLIGRYPIWSIEDGLDEGDDDGWKLLTTRLGDRIQLVGDDNFVTNPAIITDAIAGGIANAALIKLNQVGTVTETLAAMAVCREAGYAQMISHRSGRPPTPSSPTWPSPRGAARSSPAPARGSAPPSTTGCSPSSGTTRALGSAWLGDVGSALRRRSPRHSSRVSSPFAGSSQHGRGTIAPCRMHPSCSWNKLWSSRLPSARSSHRGCWQASMTRWRTARWSSSSGPRRLHDAPRRSPPLA